MAGAPFRSEEILLSLSSSEPGVKEPDRSLAPASAPPAVEAELPSKLSISPDMPTISPRAAYCAVCKWKLRCPLMRHEAR
jgi:hypothetical protein